MAVTLEGKVVWFALISRITVIILQITFNLLIPDHKPDVFNPPLDPNARKYVGDAVVDILLGGLKRWDGVYFLHIAEHGYTYQNCLAFFPLFPFVIRFLANTLFCPLQYVLSYSRVLQVSGLCVNVYCFTMAALMLYRLGLTILQNKTLAYKASLLFCLNPASIFMTAPYSEAMFSYLTFRGLMSFQERKLFKSSLRFGISAIVRSNGLTNFGFIFYIKMKELFLQMCDIKRTGFIDWSSVRAITAGVTFITLTPTFIYLVVMFIPFILWQYYAYNIFCQENNPEASKIPDFLIQYGKTRGYILMGSPPQDWCRSSLPSSYSYVQSSHWGVGLFQYFEAKQIPNFLLASPIVVLSLLSAWNYVKRNLKYCLALGLLDEQTLVKKTDEPVKTSGIFGTDMFVYVAHMVFLTLFGLLFMHVQVLTRFLCSSTPVIYWFLAWNTTSSADLIEDGEEYVNKYSVMKTNSRQKPIESPANLNSVVKTILTDQLIHWNQCSSSTKCIFIYFLGYFVIGTAIFSNFLPWT